MKNIFISVVGIILIIIVLVIVGRSAESPTEETPVAIGSGGTLQAEELFFDFGSIKMAKGNVSHTFKIANSGAEDLIIESIYTSCMCTNAVLTLGGEKFGPFGMPGHGLLPKIEKVIASEGEADIEVTFDPAAHGPAGIGKVERSIIIENSAGEPLELKFTATVTP